MIYIVVGAAAVFLVGVLLGYWIGHSQGAKYVLDHLTEPLTRDATEVLNPDGTTKRITDWPNDPNR